MPPVLRMDIKKLVHVKYVGHTILIKMMKTSSRHLDTTTKQNSQ